MVVVNNKRFFFAAGCTAILLLCLHGVVFRDGHSVLLVQVPGSSIALLISILAILLLALAAMAGTTIKPLFVFRKHLYVKLLSALRTELCHADEIVFAHVNQGHFQEEQPCA